MLIPKVQVVWEAAPSPGGLLELLSQQLSIIDCRDLDYRSPPSAQGLTLPHTLGTPLPLPLYSGSPALTDGTN